MNNISDVDCVLVVGSDIKRELPLLNARLRSCWLRDSMQIASVGASYDVENFPISTLGISITDFEVFLKGQHKFCKA